MIFILVSCNDILVMVHYALNQYMLKPDFTFCHVCVDVNVRVNATTGMNPDFGIIMCFTLSLHI